MKASVKLHGKAEGFPETTLLKAGNLSMIFENGCIRDICQDETEIIRMIYFTVRDKNWVTVLPEINRQQIVEIRNGIRITCNIRYRHHDIDFEATVRFRIRKNSLIAEMNGKALSSFLKNRIGFCILHPLKSCAGKKCVVIHPDGTFSQEQFPRSIKPGQPFKNIQALVWPFSDTGMVRLKFDGDIFETEDQRNWTDASFKTYGTPLELPFPVQVKKGETMHQKIELALEGGSAATATRAEVTTVYISDETLDSFPDIGIGSSSRTRPVTVKEAEIIRNIRFSHLRGEVHLFDEKWERQYSMLAEEADKTGWPVELCLLFGPEPQAEFGSFLRLFENHPIRIKRIIVLSKTMKTTPASLISDIVPVIRKVFPGIPAGVGTNCNFAELNRQRPSSDRIDTIALAIHPQEHAGDERSLIENAAAQEDVIKSAAEIYPGKPICVSPVTLQRRFNANIATYEMPDDVPSNIDPRQMSLFGAAWTVASLKYLIEAGVASITYFETLGERGLLMGEYGSRWPLLFPAKKGMIFPVFHIFRLLLQNPGARVIRTTSERPLVVDGFTIAADNKGLIFLSNMTPRYQKVVLNGIREYRVMFRMHTVNFDLITRQIQLPGETKNDKLFASHLGSFRIRPFETMIIHFPR